MSTTRPETPEEETQQGEDGPSVTSFGCRSRLVEAWAGAVCSADFLVAVTYVCVAFVIPQLVKQHTRRTPVETIPSSVEDEEDVYVRSPLLDNAYKPSSKQIVPTPALAAICVLVPAAVQGLLSLQGCVIIRPGAKSARDGESEDQSVHKKRAAVAFRLYSLLYAAGTTICVVDLLKRYCGYWRPYFYKECNYDPATGECDSSDVDDDAFRSFPSGHAAFSAVSLGHAALCLLAAIEPGRPMDRHSIFCCLLPLRSGGHRLARAGGICAVDVGNLTAVAALSPAFLALWIAATRVVDNDHHPADVVAGSAIGFVCAWIFYSRYFPGPFEPDASSPRAAFLRAAQRESHSNGGFGASSSSSYGTRAGLSVSDNGATSTDKGAAPYQLDHV